MSPMLSYLHENAVQLLDLWFTMQLQTAGFILLVWLVERTLPREWATPRFRYLLWTTVLVKALLPPIFAMPAAESLPAATYLLAPVEAVGLAAPPVEGTAFSLPLLLLIAILGSSLILAGVAVFRGLALRRALKNARPFDAPTRGEWPPIFVSDSIPSPLATGLRRPRIYITPAIAHAPQDILLAVLQHERAHIRRRDSLMVLLQTLVQIAYVLNPLMWLANLRMFRYRELICDGEAMVSAGTRPQDYGRLLVDFAEAQPARILQTGTCFFETRRGFVQRINELFSGGGRTVMRGKHYTAVVVLSLFVLPLSWHCEQEATITETYTEPLQESLAAERPAATETSDLAAVTSKNEYEKQKQTQMQAEKQKQVQMQPEKEKQAQMQAEKEKQAQMQAQAQKQAQEKLTSMAGPQIDGGMEALSAQIKYPESATKEGIEGTVIVEATIEEDGPASALRVVRSVHPLLDAAALEAVKGVRFTAGVQDGKPIPSTISVPIRFRLK